MSTVEGSRRRDAAIDAVEKAANDAWRAAALAAVRRVAELRARFTTDAVWAVLERDGARAPREPRAMGAVMRGAMALRICERLDERHKSVRAECHRRPLQVYRSLLAFDK